MLEANSGNILHQIAGSIRKARELPEIFNASVSGIQRFLKVDRVKLYQFDEDGSGTVIAEARAGDRLPALLGLRFPAEDIPPTARQSFSRLRQCAIADVRTGRKTLVPLDPQLSSYQERVSDCHARYLEAMGVRSSLILPVFERSQLWGLLSVHHSEPRCYSPHEQQLLQLAIDQIAIAITQARLIERTQRTARYEAAIARIDRLLDEDLPGATLLENVLQESVAALDGSGGRLYLCAKATRESPQLYTCGDRISRIDLEALPDWEEGFRHHNPLTLDASPHPAPRTLTAQDWNQQPSLAFLRDAFADTPVRSLLVIPLQYQQQCVGYLSLFRRGYDLEVWWAGRNDRDRRQNLPRTSFEAWCEHHRDRARPWNGDECKFAHALGVHLYMAVVQRRVNAMLHYQVSHDPLTNLPNRILFDEQLSLALLEAQQQNLTLGVGFLDIDRFKAINDSFGHPVGDRLIVTLTRRIRNRLNPGDSIARWGGDELVFLFSDASCRDGIERAAERILDDLREPLELDGRELYITASFGLALYPEDGRDAAALIGRAETAMDWAKQQGRNNAQRYHPEMSGANADLLALEIDLRKAISNGEFCLHYQPQIDLGSGTIVGVEALVRWEHPTRGRISPDRFIPIAEENGSINALGEWVLRTACQQHRQWIEAGFISVRMAVNLSAHQLQQPDLVEQIAAILHETQMSPSNLELEITETAAVKNLDLTVLVLRQLREMGIHIAMDDFGTGYSCLSSIGQFPLDTLKIDRSFVRDLTHNATDAAIARTIIALGQGLSLIVLAEGVESHDQVEFLKSIHCDLAQGYLFSRPVPAAEMPDLFRHWSLSAGIEKVPIRLPHARADQRRRPPERRFALRQRMRDLERGQIALTRDRDRLQANYDALAQQHQRDRALVTLAQAVLAGQPFESLVRSVVADVRRHLCVTRAAIYRYDANGNLLPVAQDDADSSRSHALLVPDLRSLQTAATPDVLTLSGGDFSQLSADDAVVLAHHGVRACAIAPILTRDRIWGAIVLHQDRYERQWHADELTWLQQVAQLLTHAAPPLDAGIAVFCTRDRLTQVLDRDSFERRLRYDWERLSRLQQPLGLAIVRLSPPARSADGDHAIGDAHLRERLLPHLAEAWCQTLTRTGRFVARSDDLELVALLPYLDVERSREVAERLRERSQAVLNARLPQWAQRVSLQFGVASLVPQHDRSPQLLVRHARQHLSPPHPYDGGDRAQPLALNPSAFGSERYRPGDPSRDNREN